MVAHGTPCLGPVTHAGCGALCPAYARGCYGCFGPMETPNTGVADATVDRTRGRATTRSVRAFRGFNAYAEPFRKESEAHERNERPDTRPSRSTTWRASKAKARSTSRSAAARSKTCSSGSSSRRASSRRFLRGRSYREAPDITARICGICPVAYQMSAVHAMERALGVTRGRSAARAAPPALLRRVDREPRAARLHAACARLPRLSRMRSAWRRLSAKP